MLQYLAPLEQVDIYLYQPNKLIKATLATEDNLKPAKLTPQRAELLYLLFYYETSGEESSLFVANKLAYFLQRLGHKQLDLRFKRHLCGPYSHQVDHVMYALNGTYIQGLEQRQARAFERLHLVYETFPAIQSYIAQALSDAHKL